MMKLNFLRPPAFAVSRIKGHAPMLRKIAMFMMLFTVNTHLSAFNKIFPPDPVMAAEWIFDKTVDNVDCYHQLTVCEGATVVLLKFNNKNKYPVNITWKNVFITASGERVNGCRGQINLLILPGETFGSGCKDENNKTLLLTSSDVSVSHKINISSFSFGDITVNSIRK